MRGYFLHCCGWTLVLTGMLQTVAAQGLVWNLPESGTWARYAGEYRQVTVRPTSTEGDLTLQWQCLLEIRCLERTTAEWKGEQVSCVWLELESQIGQQVDGQLETGPGSVRLYKILVPEQEVIGKAFFDLPIPRAYLPVVQGYRKIGEGDVQPLQGNVFQTFPVLSQVLINEQAKIAGEDTVTVQAGSADAPREIAATRIENSTVIQELSSRSTNNTTLWISDEIPFGSVRWIVRTERETKTLVDTRDLFKKHSEFSVEMNLVQTGSDAAAKLNTP